MATSSKLSARLSKRLAGFKLSDAVIKELAGRIQVDGLDIGRFHPCIYGICVDYWSDKPPVLDPFWKRGGIARLEVFPYGIIDWDRYLRWSDRRYQERWAARGRQ